MKLCWLPLLLLASYSASATEQPSASLDSVPPQLNVPGFAYCLAQEAPRVDLDAERSAHGMSEKDLLLLYLSVYPGKRLPAPLSLLQDSAHKRWTIAFEDREKLLAERILARAGSAPGSLAPSRLFRDALEVCGAGGGNSPFCAALISHNVLRTLGRHAQAIYRNPLTGQTQDLNPGWFRSDSERWLEQIPRLQSLLMSLRPDEQGDGWGEWYHFFGILSFSIHELALRQGISGVDLVVRLNELLNPLLAGGPETPEKARLDRDSVQVDWDFVRGEGLAAVGSCDERASYVAASKSTIE